MFYYCTQYCNSVRMTCLIKRLLASYLILTHIIVEVAKALGSN